MTQPASTAFLETDTTLPGPVNIAAVRAEFPILARQVYDKPLVYLDNAASAQKPRAVMDAMRHAMEGEYSNVHRGVHFLSQKATTAFERAREKVAGFLNAPSPDNRGRMPCSTWAASPCAWSRLPRLPPHPPTGRFWKVTDCPAPAARTAGWTCRAAAPSISPDPTTTIRKIHREVPAMADVTLRKVRKAFGDVEIIHGIDLDIKDNEFTVFVGPSGCGKSTLLRLIAGLEDITSGEMRIDGELVNDLPPAQRGIAMVFQSYALYPHMTVYENMAFGLELAKSSKAEIKEAVQKAADILELTPLLDRLPKQLSGGQRQRVAIGRAIVREPKVFLFDEPLSNLDAALRVQMRIEIAKLHKDMGVTMIYVTHDQVEAMTLADKIVVLNAGNIEQVGHPLELYHNPQNLFVAGFIGSPRMNFIETKVDTATGDTVTMSLPGGGRAIAKVDGSRAKPGQKVTLGIRPEHVTLEPADSMLTGKIDVIEQLGEAYLLHVRLADRSIFTAKLPGDSHQKEGDEVTLGFDGALWVKRDDRSSDWYGGNKVRKLEYLLADAQAVGAGRVITTGVVGSHHCLATAVHGRRIGLPVTLVVFPQPETPHALEIAALNEAWADEVRRCGSFATQPFAEAAVRWRHRADRPYVIPGGGSNALGALGYVAGALELAEQVEAGVLPRPDTITVAAGTLGTLAGLALGAAMTGLTDRLYGVRIVPTAVANELVLGRLVEGAAATLAEAGVRVPDPRLALSRVELVGDWIGRGYGHPTEWGARATEWSAGRELELDPSYTAKTVAALLDRLERGGSGVHLYWHTLSSTLPGEPE